MFDRLGEIYSFTGNPLIDIQIAHSKQLIILTHKSEHNKQLIQKAMIKIRDNTHLKNLPTNYLNVTSFSNQLKRLIFLQNQKRKKLKHSLIFSKK